MQQIQENLFVILSLLIFGSAAFILFKRFGKPDQSQNQIINSDEVFSELSKSKEEAAKFTALAQERKFEVEQLKRELSDLRERIDEQNVQLREHSNTIAKIHAQREAANNAANEKIEMLSKVRRDIVQRQYLRKQFPLLKHLKAILKFKAPGVKWFSKIY